MNERSLQAGIAAYEQGNFTLAVSQLAQAKQPGEVSGRVDHILGNCYMQLGYYEDAARVYADALRDPNYGKQGALACNRGRALLAAGHPQEAIASLNMVAQDKTYPTPYKGYIALGHAYESIGSFRQAGNAYRAAAIDESNPSPSGALTKLGDCFMKLDRAADAIESYRTSLDYTESASETNKVYESLGMAQFAAKHMAEALDAFARATADGTYSLSAEANAAAAAARKENSQAASESAPSETDAMLAAAGYGTSVDPLDPLGKSGELMPSPEDTGFFSLDEDEVTETDHKIRRKHRRTGRKVLFVLLIIAVLLAGGLFFAYTQGYGYPLQETLAKELFTDASTGTDFTSLLDGDLTDEQIDQITAMLPTSGVENVKAQVTARSMYETTVKVTITLTSATEPGELAYSVTFKRNGFGWKVTDVSPQNWSQNGSEASLS